MSQENFKTLRAEYAAMSRRDWNAVFEIFPRRAKALQAAGLS
jgi:hypothetical protein